MGFEPERQPLDLRKRKSRVDEHHHDQFASCLAVRSKVGRRAVRFAWFSACILATILGCGDTRKAFEQAGGGKQGDGRGFVVVSGRPVFRTKNSELLAPDQDEPVNADPASFKSVFPAASQKVDFHYASDKKKVFIGVNRRVYELEAADPMTFRVLDKEGYFAADQSNVYYLGFRLVDVDAKSFEVVGKHFGKDKGSVFFGPIHLVKADPQSFVVLSEGASSLLKLGTSGPGPYRSYAFHVKHETIEFQGFWSKDDQHCFHGDNMIEVADAATFRVLDPKNAEDKNWSFKEGGNGSLKYFRKAKSSGT